MKSKVSTTKLYHQSPFQINCLATVLEISLEKGLVLDRTTAYAEAGGQEGDKGFIIRQNRDKVSFSDTQIGPGRPLYLDNFPVIQVENPIFHKIDNIEDYQFRIGEVVEVHIDVERRAKLTIAHSGIHIVLMGLEKNIPDIYKRIKGCHIREGSSRLDFRIENKFSNDILEKVRLYVGELITRDVKMSVFPSSIEPEAWYWKCEDITYPCGGTHLTSTSALGEIVVRKKNLGKNGQRIYAEFPNPILPIEQYHYEV